MGRLNSVGDGIPLWQRCSGVVWDLCSTDTMTEETGESPDTESCVYTSGACQRWGSPQEPSLPSVQFCYESKTVLKNEV